jgi:hypothetical protein
LYYRAFYYFNVQKTGRPPYPPAVCSKTYHGYAKLRIIPNAAYNVIHKYGKVQLINYAQ